jgi:predicted regulator of Ras-like GTPase activity (Roadblock/LC7/MglB family)
VAADFVAGLSTDVTACVLLDSDGRLVAADEAHAGSSEELAGLGRELLERAQASQLEVSTGTGIVYALRAGEWALVAVTGRFALSSLMFFDMRKTLEALAA